MKQSRNILAYFSEVFSNSQGPLKALVSVLFVITGSVFFYHNIFATYIPGILMIAWILIKESPTFFFSKFIKSGVWLFLLVYLFFAISILYSDDKSIAVRFMGTKLLFPLLPLLMVKRWKPSQKLIHLMMILLIISFIFMLISLWIKMYQVYATGYTEHWRFQQTWYLDRKYGLHHGDYSILGMLITIYFLTGLYKEKSKLIKWVPIVIFWVIILITGADISKLISMVIVLILFVDFIWKGFLRAFPYIYAFSLTVILLLIFILFSSGQLDIRENDRFIIWPVSLELIKEKPLSGYGIGDVTGKMRAKYIELDYQEGIETNYNSHNQFMDITLTSGVGGLAALLTLLIYSAFQISKKENLYGVLYIVTITLYMLVENVLSRLDGVIIVSLYFVVFLSLSGKSCKTKIEAKIFRE